MNGGFISTQSADPGARPAAAKAAAGAATSRQTARTRSRETVARRVLARERRQRRIDLDQRDGEAVDAPRQRQSGGADAGAEIDRVIAGARGGRRREQDGVMADAMAAQRLAQHQPAAEDGVLARLGRSAGIAAKLVAEAGFGKQPSRGIELVLADQDAPRENADRAFQHAHVLIDHQMIDVARP